MEVRPAAVRQRQRQRAPGREPVSLDEVQDALELAIERQVFVETRPAG